MDPENPRLNQIPEGVFYRAPETLPVLVKRIVHEQGQEKDEQHMSPPAGELTLRTNHDPSRQIKEQSDQKRHWEPPPQEFTPLDILPALANASMFGLFVGLTWGKTAGVISACGAFGVWLGIILALWTPRASQSRQERIRATLDALPPAQSYRDPRIRTGEDAEQILKAFREGKQI